MTRMSILPLLTCAAIPFEFPANDHSIAARRHRSKKLSKEFSCRDKQQQVEQHLLMTTALDMGAEAIRQEVATSPCLRKNTSTILRPPPNSPNTQLTFDFPDPAMINHQHVELEPQTRPGAEQEDQSPAKTFTRLSRGRRSQCKRRRVPSFKTKTEPRVPAKVSAVDLAASEADDEASDEDEVTVQFSAMQRDLSLLTRATRQLDFSSSEDEDEDELQLKLKVLSEVRTFCHDNDEKLEKLEKTDWAKVGSELRHIADKFTDESSSTSATDDEDRPDGMAAPGGAVDLVSLLNLMLPFSVPQSLWSALVSYAAWKIFKRFQ